MEIKITGKNIELAPNSRDYISNKLDKIVRHLPSILSFDVVAVEEKTKDPNFRYIIQVTINNNGTIIRGEERASELKTAVDKVTEVISRQVEHFKGKRPYSKKRKTPSIRLIAAEEPVQTGRAEPAEETQPQVVKNKSFVVKPLSLEQAIDQMELLDHDFFLFLNQESKIVNLLYRRNDGDYGLIEANV